jgi:glyoxylase-like metal-dependent hydrolase (beta-lactamase superfamily II)
MLEALSFPSMRQKAPDLLLYPIFYVAEAVTGMSSREIIHPPPEHRIYQVYHPVNRLRTVYRHILEAANGLSRDPVKHLINTHWHFDHTDGMNG